MILCVMCFALCPACLPCMRTPSLICSCECHPARVVCARKRSSDAVTTGCRCHHLPHIAWPCTQSLVHPQQEGSGAYIWLCGLGRIDELGCLRASCLVVTVTVSLHRRASGSNARNWFLVACVFCYGPVVFYFMLNVHCLNPL